jgi:hypothetical protein
MPKKPIPWEVIRIRASPAAFVGVVHAPDEKAALEAAIKNLRSGQKSRTAC